MDAKERSPRPIGVIVVSLGNKSRRAGRRCDLAQLVQIGAKRNIAHRNTNGPVLETLLAAIRHDQLAAGAKQDALDTTTVAALRVLDHFSPMPVWSMQARATR